MTSSCPRWNQISETISFFLPRSTTRSFSLFYSPSEFLAFLIFPLNVFAFLIKRRRSKTLYFCTTNGCLLRATIHPSFNQNMQESVEVFVGARKKTKINARRQREEASKACEICFSWRFPGNPKTATFQLHACQLRKCSFLNNMHCMFKLKIGQKL